MFQACIKMLSDIEDMFYAHLKLVLVICANIKKLQKLSKSYKTCKSYQKVIWFSNKVFAACCCKISKETKVVKNLQKL